jgi:hypothetical protein
MSLSANHGIGDDLRGGNMSLSANTGNCERENISVCEYLRGGEYESEHVHWYLRVSERR